MNFFWGLHQRVVPPTKHFQRGCHPRLKHPGDSSLLPEALRDHQGLLSLRHRFLYQRLRLVIVQLHWLIAIRADLSQTVWGGQLWEVVKNIVFLRKFAEIGYQWVQLCCFEIREGDAMAKSPGSVPGSSSPLLC